MCVILKKKCIDEFTHTHTANMCRETPLSERLSSCGARCQLHVKFWSFGARLVDMTRPPGKEELHPDRVSKLKPTLPGAHIVDTG